MNVTEIFAERFKQLRKSKGLSLQKVAQDLNVTAQSLSLYEKAQRTINIDLLVKIANYFDVSADYLLGLVTAPDVDKNLNAISKYTEISSETLSKLMCLAKSFPDDMFNDFINNYLDKILTSSLFALAKTDDYNLVNFIMQYGKNGFDLEIRPNCEDLTQDAIKNAYKKLVTDLYSWHTYNAAAYVKKFIEKNTDMSQFEKNVENMSSELYKYYVEEASGNGNHNPKEK